MRILAFDTSSQTASVAVLQDDDILYVDNLSIEYAKE